MAPAQPPRAAGRAAIDAAKLLQGALPPSTRPREGPLRILRSGCPPAGAQTPLPGCLLPTFWPGGSRGPAPAASRPLAAAPLNDFAATQKRGCAPNKGAPAAPRARPAGRAVGGGRLTLRARGRRAGVTDGAAWTSASAASHPTYVSQIGRAHV